MARRPPSGMLGAMTSTSAPRELAARVNDGIHVALLWHPATDEVCVRVDDRRLGVRFEAPVAAERALHAFIHPFTYAA